MWVMSPLNSPGERTSIIGGFALHVRERLLVKGADLGILAGAPARDNAVGANFGFSLVSGRPSATHLSRPPLRIFTFVWPKRRKAQSA